MSSQIKRIYAAFDPAPRDHNQQDLYVRLDEFRGETGVAHDIARKIELEGKPTCQVLAGHRGSGKSTELNRLAVVLEQRDPEYFVVQCTASHAAGIRKGSPSSAN